MDILLIVFIIPIELGKIPCRPRITFTGAKPQADHKLWQRHKNKTKLILAESQSHPVEVWNIEKVLQTLRINFTLTYGVAIGYDKF